MKASSPGDGLVVGLDVPAQVGMHLAEVVTPALIIDLDAFEHNVTLMKLYSVTGLSRIKHKNQEPAHKKNKNNPCQPA